MYEITVPTNPANCGRTNNSLHRVRSRRVLKAFELEANLNSSDRDTVKYYTMSRMIIGFGRPSKARLFCLIPERMIVAPGTTIRGYLTQLTMNERPVKSVGDRL